MSATSRAIKEAMGLGATASLTKQMAEMSATSRAIKEAMGLGATAGLTKQMAEMSATSRAIKEAMGLGATAGLTKQMAEMSATSRAIKEAMGLGLSVGFASAVSALDLAVLTRAASPAVVAGATISRDLALKRIRSGAKSEPPNAAVVIYESAWNADSQPDETDKVEFFLRQLESDGTVLFRGFKTLPESIGLANWIIITLMVVQILLAW
ncbi:MAG: hypothetical protein KF694_22780 [Mesorhizobium sp.]|nr:hypothetical protein [Mesorhizobium sp.]